MKTGQSITGFIRKQKTVLIGSVDEDGFPNMKAMFTPRKNLVYRRYHIL